MAKRALHSTPTDSEHVPCTSEAEGCQIQDLFKLLGKSHTLDILHLFVIEDANHTMRFVEIQRALKLSPNTLSERLRELVDAGLLARQSFNEIPPRVDYQATRKARDLEPVFDELIEWAKKHNLAPMGTQPTAEAAG